MIDINLNKSSRVSKMFTEVTRKILPFLAVLAILFSSVLSLPDVHAGEGVRMARTTLIRTMQRQTMMNRTIRQRTTTIAVLVSLTPACSCDHLSGVRIT